MYFLLLTNFLGGIYAKHVISDTETALAPDFLLNFEIDEAEN